MTPKANKKLEAPVAKLSLAEEIARVSDRDENYKGSCPHCGEEFIADMAITPRMVKEIVALVLKRIEKAKLTDKELTKIYPPPGTKEYPEWDICDGCPFPQMAIKAYRDKIKKELE
jgi:hypothetical protein